jgi:hypothetical protein
MKSKEIEDDEEGEHSGLAEEEKKINGNKKPLTGGGSTNFVSTTTISDKDI